jgi:hypothetical protein
MGERPDDLDPSVEVHLTKAGAIRDAEPDREWFAESVRLSQRALAEGRRWADKELQGILDDSCE